MGDYSDWSWGVVETRPNAETIAERALQDIGYEPLVVRYKKLLRGVRIHGERRIRCRKDTLIERPFIPGYLFLPIPSDDDCTLVDTARGVKRIFRHRDHEGYLSRPKLIRGRVVEQVKAAALEKDETPKDITLPRPDLQAALTQASKTGDMVQVRLPTGIVAHLLSLNAHGRAHYFTTLMGREIRGSIDDAEKLELVGA